MPYWDNPYSTEPTPTDTSGGADIWGDHLDSLLAAGASAISGVAALGRAASDKSDSPVTQFTGALAKYLQDTTGQYAQDRVQEMTPVAQASLNAGFGSEDFWKHPVLSTTLKAVGMVPAGAAALLPGGILADAVAAEATGAAAFGVIGAGDITDQIYKQTDALSDKDLQAQSATYAKLRAGGLPEDAARQQFNAQLLGAKPLISFVVSAAAGLVPAGALGGGIVKGAVKGAATGAAALGVQGATQDVLTQQAAVQSGAQSSINVEQAVNAGMQGAVTGGLLGGVGGALGARAEAKPKPDRTIVSADQAAALDATLNRPAPVTSEVTAPSVSTPKDTQTIVSPDQAAALAAVQVKAPETKPPEVAQPQVQPPVPPRPAAPSPVDNPIVADQLLRQATAPEPTQGAKPTIQVDGAKPVAEAPPAPAKAVVKPVDQPVVPRAPGEARVLPDISSEGKAAAAAAKEVGAAEAKKVESFLKTDGKPGPGSKDLKRVGKIQADGQAALEIFNEHAPDQAEFPSSPAELQALKDRLDTIVQKAKDADIKVPAKVGYKTTPDGLIWLREATDLRGKFDSKDGRPSDGQIQSFLGREAAAKGGDFSVMRSERKSEGEAFSRKNQGDVETMAATSEVAAKPVEEAPAKSVDEELKAAPAGGGGGAEKDAVTVAVPKSAKGSARLDAMTEKVAENVGGQIVERERQKAASAVKRVEITPELKAKALAALEASRKKDDGKAAPRPAPGAKGEAVKEKAKSLAAEAKKVAAKPTDAQKEAGNYQKGHVPLHGLDVTIETSKGQERTGVTPEGKKWSVTMPDHYGYIKRTKGADGDHVDAYLGPKARPGSKDLEKAPVIVIDQVNPDTKAFDEHKVMLGYDDVRHATDAYQKAFSDGKGQARIGDVRVMSLDEFKTWLKEGNTKKPIGDAEIAREAFEQDRTIDTGLGPAIIPGPADGGTPKGWGAVEGSGKAAKDIWDPSKPRIGNIQEKATATSTVSTFLKTAGKRLDLFKSITESTPTSKLAQALFPKMAARIAEMAGNVPVHIVPDDTYAASVGNVPMGHSSGGYFDSNMNAIVLPERTANSSAENFAHTVLHEATHAAVMRATWESPSIRNSIERVAQEAREGLMRLGPKADFEGTSYSFTNLDEFVAEAFSNPKLQKFLAETPASVDLAMGLEANRGRSIGSSVRSLWTSLVDVARRALGLSSAHNSLLDAMMHIGGEIEHTSQEFGTAPLNRAEQEARQVELKSRREDPYGPWLRKQTTTMASQAHYLTEKIDELWNRPDLAKTMGKPKLLKLVTLDHIARTADGYFGSNNPVRKVADLLENRSAQKNKNLAQASPIITKLFDLERKYRAVDAGMGADGKPVTMWDKFASLVHDETMAGVFSDKSIAENTHLGKDALYGVWGKAQHGDLARRYNELPNELKAAHKQAQAYYGRTQDAMSLGLIRNTLKAMTGVDDEPLAQRLMTDTLTDADKASFDPGVLQHIKDAKELSKIDGPYSPLMRRGDHVVVAHYKIDAPTGANVRAIGDQTHGAHEFEFSGPKARDNAIAYAKTQETRPTIKGVWVDKTTGEQFVKDTDGTEVKVTKEDANAEQRFQVSVQNKHVEFVDGKTNALRLQKQLEDKVGTLFTHVNGAEAARTNTNSNADLVSHQMQTLVNSLRQRATFKAMTPAMQTELTNSLREASLRMLGSTRIQTKRLPRTYVQGASRDLTRNAYEYAQSTSGYLAKLQVQPQLDAAMKELADASTGDQAKETVLGRSHINEEVKRRVTGDYGFQEGGKYSPAVQRVLTSSFISHLASVSYSVINATQPIMLTGPMLAARHGIGKSVGAMVRAYSDIGALGMVKKGAVDTFNKARSPRADTGNFLETTKAKLNSREAKMLDTLASVGSIDPEGGMEVGQLPRQRAGGTSLQHHATNMLDQGLSYVDGIARQMPTAIEAINRYVSALAAYRLEFEKTGDHDASVQHAQDIVNSTQFNYSSANAPPVFNKHPLARLAFQFKKFGLGVYQLLGQQIGKAYRNASPGDRAEALKALGGIAAMHVAMAGTLGLPTEPIKALVMGAHLAGLTGATWQDVEDAERQAAANTFGKTAGEMLTKGLPRGIPGGFAPDISGRIGLDTLFTFGEPKSANVNDAALWFANTVGGAPFGLAQSWYTGVQKLTSGDLSGAAQDLIPVKTFTDALKAYKTATEGKKSSTGQGTMSPYSLPEAAVRVLGFTPEREAEDQSKRATFYGKQQAATTSRTTLTDNWINASPQDRQKMWGSVESWNAGQDPGNRLTRAALDSAAKRRATSVGTGATRQGIRTTSRDKSILDKLDQTYNAP